MGQPRHWHERSLMVTAYVQNNMMLARNFAFRSLIRIKPDF
jgi:hypothetical protein